VCGFFLSVGEYEEMSLWRDFVWHRPDGVDHQVAKQHFGRPQGKKVIHNGKKLSPKVFFKMWITLPKKRKINLENGYKGYIFVSHN
jgi:hypothetical protein